METSGIGSSLITAAGAGSKDFEVESTAVGLASAETMVARSRLEDRTEEANLKLSAFGTLRSALEGFQYNISTLSSLSNLQQRTVSSSDYSVVAATVTQSAAEGSYQLEVSQLAQAHSIYSSHFDSTTDSVGTGTLTFNFGTVGASFAGNGEKSGGPVTIASSNNSLSGIGAAVNNAAIGVRASIVNDGTGNRLTFTSESTGGSSGLQVVVDDGDGVDDDASGLSLLHYDGTTGSGNQLTQSIAGQDALLKVNGLDITSSSNTVSDAMEGVTLNLLSSDAGSVKTLTVTTDKTTLKTSISNFVLDFNALRSVTDSLSSYDSTTGDTAQLQGDSTLRSLVSEIRSITGNTIENLSGNYTSLSSIGLSLSANNDGKLVLDEGELDAALAADFDAVGKLFAATATPSDSLVEYSEHTADTTPGDYALNVTQLATQGELTVGATVSSFVVDSGNDAFTMKVDGITSETITITQKDYTTGTALAAEIQNRINADSNLKDNQVSVVVSYETDHFVVTSNRYGSASTVEILTVEDVTQSGNIGLVTGAGVTGVDVAGTIDGVAATGSGQYLTASSGDAEGLKVWVKGGVTGDRGTVAMSRGYVDQLGRALDGYVEEDGVLEIREETLNDKLTGYSEDSTKLDARYEVLLSRYRRQFSTLNALLGQLESQREWMTATFEGLNGSD